jgi:ketosteroid isomerase-like protein
VYLYTEDAILVESGERVEGRPALLAMARAMKPLSSVSMAPRHTEGDGRLAYVVGTASWVGSHGPTNVQALMIWRKEPDGVWRIAYESLSPEK